MSHINLQVGDYILLANGVVLGPMVRSMITPILFKLAKPGTPGRFSADLYRTAKWDEHGVFASALKGVGSNPLELRVVRTTKEHRTARAWYMGQFHVSPTSAADLPPPTDKNEAYITSYIHAMNRLNRSIEKLAAQLRLASTTSFTVAESATEEEREKLRKALRSTGIPQIEPSTGYIFHLPVKAQDEIETQIRPSEKAEGGLSDFEAAHRNYITAKRLLNESYGKFGRNLNRDYGKMATSKFEQDVLDRLYAAFPTEESARRQWEDEISASMAAENGRGLAEGWPAPAEEYERRADGKIVRKDRFETGFRNIVSIIVGPRTEWEVADIVERVRELAALGKGSHAHPAFIKGRYRNWLDHANKHDLIMGLEDAFTAGFTTGEQDEIARQKRLAEGSKQAERSAAPSPGLPLTGKPLREMNPAVLSFLRAAAEANSAEFRGAMMPMPNKITASYGYADQEFGFTIDISAPRGVRLPDLRASKNPESNHPAAVESVVAAYQESGE